MKVCFCLLIVFTLVFLGVGIRGIYKQHDMISTCLPVDVVIISKKINSVTSTSNGRSETTYCPIINYRYYVNDQEYTNNKVFPLDYSSSRKWANQVLNRFAVNQTYQGWTDPDDPTKAYLIRECNYLPYIFAQIALFPGAILIYLRQ